VTVREDPSRSPDPWAVDPENHWRRGGHPYGDCAAGGYGQPGHSGGSSGALTWGKLPPPKMGSIGVPPNPCRVSVPVVRWPDAILEGRAGGYPSDVKAVYNVGGNYLVQGSDTKKSIRAFKRLEFAVCHDCFLTPTARYCDVVLPATTSLERDDIIIPTNGNYLLYSNRAVPPRHQSRTDYDIFCALADRLGFLAEYSEGRSPEDWLKHFVSQSEVGDYEEFKRTSIYMARDQLRVGRSDFGRSARLSPEHAVGAC
jgi:anaerobic dimethyl sulfoxide reductase subunit A